MIIPGLQDDHRRRLRPGGRHGRRHRRNNEGSHPLRRRARDSSRTKPVWAPRRTPTRRRRSTTRRSRGFVAIMGVFITTFMIITMTALIILTTGSLDGVTSGSALTQKAFTAGLGSLGSPFVAVCNLLLRLLDDHRLVLLRRAERQVPLRQQAASDIQMHSDVLHRPRFHAEARPRMAARGLLQRNHGLSRTSSPSSDLRRSSATPSTISTRRAS